MKTIKSYTDLEQSKKLAEILPLESADMHYNNGSCRGVDYTEHFSAELMPYQEALHLMKIYKTNFMFQVIPCWSLTALLELIPTDDKTDEYYVNTESHSDYHTVSYRNCWDGCVHSEYSEESLLDATFEMVVWLKKNKKL